MSKCTACECLCPLCNNRRSYQLISQSMRVMSSHSCDELSNHLIRPFLVSLSTLFPGLFPPHWIRCPPVRTIQAVATDRQSLRALYLMVCEYVSNHTVCDDEYRVDVSGLVETISRWGERIYSRLLTRRRAIHGYGSRRRGAYRVFTVRIMAQIDEIRGLDAVFHRLRSQLQDICCDRCPSYDPAGLCRFACYVGMVGRMRRIAVDFRDQCVLPYTGKVYLNDLIMQLDAVVSLEQSIWLAAAMSLHARLGRCSPLSVLGADILPLCMPRLIYEPVGSWSTIINC